MARSGLRDPLDKFRWTVSIDGFSKLGFTNCGTPDFAITARDYPEGGNHLQPKKIIDSVTYKPVILARGVSNDTSFNKWATGFIDIVQNNQGLGKPITDVSISDVFAASSDNGARPVANSSNKKGQYRKDVKIEHVNRAGQVEVVYYLYNAFPIEYKPASDFDSSADDGVSIESITLAYESFEVKYTGISGFAGNMLAKALL
jgi:phage tail-like protein